MSKNKGFSITSANRYSLALYELAIENDLIFKLENNSQAFLKMISHNKEFKSFMDQTEKAKIQNKAMGGLIDKPLIGGNRYI